jgi:3-hydroxyisobutyrate dehydrogenase-like beta-hydroxyacid dehydrogenase
MSSVGFIGLGTMGGPMAHNLLKAGHRLVFFARRPDVADEFTAAGGTRAATPAEVTRQADFVITIVTADEQLSEVALGDNGILAGAAPGKMLIDMSTVGPWTERAIGARLAERGMDMLDAPVSGGPWGAQAGTLSIMVGGEAAVFDRSRDVLRAMGDEQKIFHLGPLGSGQTVKLINQMLGGAMMALIGEGLVLAKAAGVDLDRLADVVQVSSGNSTVFENRARKFVLADQYVPGFKTSLMRKDVGLALELGQQLNVPLPVAAASYQQYTSAMGLGQADADFAAVVKACEQMANRKIVG